ncbi:MAG: hypothetical protein HY513_02575 [Candidatus Aenigmarchaeota archaeon]|nr:hypothetical protein [Candidatus Aenigmarchaeota archaeon]
MRYAAIGLVLALLLVPLSFALYAPAVQSGEHGACMIVGLGHGCGAGNHLPERSFDNSMIRSAGYGSSIHHGFRMMP